MVVRCNHLGCGHIRFPSGLSRVIFAVVPSDRVAGHPDVHPVLCRTTLLASVAVPTRRDRTKSEGEARRSASRDAMRVAIKLRPGAVIYKEQAGRPSCFVGEFSRNPVTGLRFSPADAPATLLSPVRFPAGPMDFGRSPPFARARAQGDRTFSGTPRNWPAHSRELCEVFRTRDAGVAGQHPGLDPDVRWTPREAHLCNRGKPFLPQRTQGSRSSSSCVSERWFPLRATARSSPPQPRQGRGFHSSGLACRPHPRSPTLRQPNGGGWRMHAELPSPDSWRAGRRMSLVLNQ